MNSLLFNEESANTAYRPLADRLRPTSIEHFVGQAHLLNPGKPIYEAIAHQQPHSMILWGPPGIGKTTLAQIIASACDCNFESISAVLSGVKEIRAVVEQAKFDQANNNINTLLFVDEVHRFNKAQQDAFLPHIEDGTILFIGATTENPSFELNNALLSRARVYLLKPLSEIHLIDVIDRALTDSKKGLGHLNLQLHDNQKRMLARASDGDARRTLNYLEILSDVAELVDGQYLVSDEHIAEVMKETHRRFDKAGDSFYEQISALHKSIRGSSPDAALYWLTRMLDGGCDPIYIARRLNRMATEDIGLADPRALQITLNAWDSYTRIGSPEGDLAIAQAAVYLASAPKSNALYEAFGAARKAVAEHGSLEVPLHLRNATTNLSKDLGYGEDYRYAHHEDNAFAAGENYLPEEIQNERYYLPKENGLELHIKEKMDHFRKLNQMAKNKRYK